MNEFDEELLDGELNNRIKEYENKLKEIDNAVYKLNDERRILEDKKRILEAEFYSQTSEEEKAIATFLHKKYCGYNHTDGCGWYYNVNDWGEFAHEEFLKIARELKEFVKKANANIRL